MPAILLTPKNVEFAKRRLRLRFPDVKSSHHTEALAAGLGFRTHAALLTQLKWHEDTRAVIASVDLEQFAARLADLGYVAPQTNLLAEILRSPDMPEKHCSEFGSGDLSANNRWFFECQRRDIPNIRIEMRRKYSSLNWDCISIDPKRGARVRDDQAGGLVQKMFEQYQAHAKSDPGGSEFFGSAFVGSVDRLLPTVARNLADAWFTLLHDSTRH